MQENCENNESSTKTDETTNEDGTEDENDKNTDNFNAYIVKQTVTSVTIAWNLIKPAEVYKIEKYHKALGWHKVGWASESPTTIENLEDNFAYRFRIKALQYSEDLRQYVDFKTSKEFVGSTLSELPSTLSLFRAIKKGQQYLVKRILQRRPRLIENPGPNGYLPLANAISFGEICIIDMLLTAGASVHIGNPLNGRTPLHLAFYYGRLPVVRILLNKKANLEAFDANGMTASHFAIDANQCEILKFALECGANLEASDACGWTLLLRAVVMRSDVAILKLLVMQGANTKALDRFDQGCVNLAHLYGNEEASKYFANSKKLKENKEIKEIKENQENKEK